MAWHPLALPGANLQQHPQHATSIEAARNRTFSVGRVVGSKRTHQGVLCESNFRDISSADRHVLAHDHRRLHGLPPNRLQASLIHSVKTNAEGETIPAKHVRSTPGPSQHPLLSLAHSRYGLAPQLVTNLENLGVRAVYPWQSSCLLGKGLLDGLQNLIYTAPTGGGKSLVADILLLKRVIENPGKKAIIVLPYVALVQEKTKWLRRVVEGVSRQVSTDAFTQQLNSHSKMQISHVRVAGFFGGTKSRLTWSDCDIAVCTIEKANTMVNEAIESSSISNLAVVVLDELHMLDDEHRGYIMELMITKLMSLQARVQIVGMSATLSNPKLLADWLQAKFYVSKYRPIPIEEYLVYDNAIYPTADSRDFLKTASQLPPISLTPKPPVPTYTIAKSSHQELSSPAINAVVALAIETAVNGYGALVFCSSRQGTQHIASLISEAMPTDLTSEDLLDKRMDILASLQALSNGFETSFSRTIPAGIAFHHAGLTTEEREIVAEAYDAGFLKIMVATCSLAAGINLPARRVILHGARMGRDLVGPAMLRQMRGRAGRKGKDEVGETFLCCQKSDLQAVAEILEAELPPVVSCLTPEKRGIKRAILEVLATRLASSVETLQDYVMHSLLWQTTDHEVVLQMLDTALISLLEDELIQSITDNAYAPTTLGSAIVASSLTPEDGLFVHSDLRRALSNLVLDTEFHIFYLFTPIPQPSTTTPLTSEISWSVFRTLLDTLDEPSLRALRLIGINPALVNQMANSGLSDLKETTPTEIRAARIYRRAYSTFALRDICNEVPLHTISLKYNLARGTIQNLAQSCHGFAAGMIRFCQRMATPTIPVAFPHTSTSTSTSTSASAISSTNVGFSMLAAVLEHMVDRLRASARPDLLEMAQVTFVKGRMARLLYENGFRGVRALSEADPKSDILPIMMLVNGWKARRYDHDESDQDAEVRRLRLEEKLLGKAGVLVRSAARLWERECLRQLDEE